MITIREFQLINKLDKIAITRHAKERLRERNIKADDIIHCIELGEIIKQYVDDKPLPSCLVLGESLEGKPLHIVISKDAEFIYLITAYYPDVTQWQADLKTRKER